MDLMQTMDWASGKTERGCADEGGNKDAGRVV